MSSRAGRGPVRSYRRRKAVLDIDLNHVPSGDTREQEGPSTVLVPQQVQVIQQPQDVQEPPTQLGTGQVHALQQPPALQPPTIDVEAFDDDDVVESSPRAFAEAKNKNSSRRNRRRTMVYVDLDDQTRVTNNNSNKRSRVSLGQPIINCDLYINLEGCSSLERENMPAPEPPKEPVFNCPICIGPLVEEVSTKCGHIFCKACIKAAISAQNKCPTCRKKITVRSLIRVFLPSTS